MSGSDVRVVDVPGVRSFGRVSFRTRPGVPHDVSPTSVRVTVDGSLVDLPWVYGSDSRGTSLTARNMTCLVARPLASGTDGRGVVPETGVARS